MTPDTLRIALHSGVLVRHDAVSNSLRQKLDILQDLRAEGAPVEARAFVHHTDLDRRDVTLVPDPWTAVRDPWRSTARIHVYEFGIHYPLFDAIFATPEGTGTIGVFHNVTPIELMDTDHGREAVARSTRQMHNLWCCDEVVCISDYSRDHLLGLGFPRERLSVLPLPAAQDVAPPTDEGRGDLVTLLYVGRFVRAKGVLDLLHAASIVAEGGQPFRLVLVGELRFSDPDVVARIRETIARPPLDTIVRFEPGLPDAELARMYARADALVMPSYHEGYCVPVVEALAAECHVIAYDSSNLPYITAGLAQLVPTGDVDALASAITDYVRRAAAARTGAAMCVSTGRGEMSEGAWRTAVRSVIESRSATAFRRGVLEMLQRAARRAGHDGHALTEAAAR